MALVAAHLERKYDGKVVVRHGDAFEWAPPPGERYTVGWHDIWPNPHDATRWPEMGALEERFRPFCDWQGSWVREYLAAEQESQLLSGGSETINQRAG